MSTETIVAVSGLIGLGAAVFTGALWDSPLVRALFRLRENLRSQGRHAMPRSTVWAGAAPPIAARVPRASDLSLTPSHLFGAEEPLDDIAVRVAETAVKARSRARPCAR